MSIIKTLFLSLSVLTAACGVGFASSQAGQQKSPVATNKNNDAALRAVLKDTRVAFEWQMWLLRVLEQNPKTYKQAWAVFSDGGWSNNGQTMILEQQDGSKIMYIVHPGSKNPEPAITLSSAQWQKIKKQVDETQNLTSIEKMVFDATEYEFVTFSKRAKPTSTNYWFISKKIYLKALPAKDTKQHNDLMMAFVDLRKEHLPKKP